MQKHGNQETEASATAKTVRVLDEAGHEYEATYTKRAKGLVKHGRARFADDSQTVIILACPPNQNMILEDNTMNEQNNNTNIPDTSDLSELTKLSELTELSELSESTNSPLTAKEVFDQIAALQKQMMDQSYNALYRMTEAINDICGDDRFESDESRENAIEEVTKVFAMREKTYQQMLEFYQQMYHDLTSPQETRYAERREFMNWVRDCIDATQCGQDLPDFEKLWKIFG